MVIMICAIALVAKFMSAMNVYSHRTVLVKTYPTRLVRGISFQSHHWYSVHIDMLRLAPTGAAYRSMKIKEPL